MLHCQYTEFTPSGGHTKLSLTLMVASDDGDIAADEFAYVASAVAFVAYYAVAAADVGDHHIDPFEGRDQDTVPRILRNPHSPSSLYQDNRQKAFHSHRPQ